jgi:hypothetical protein
VKVAYIEFVDHFIHNLMTPEDYFATGIEGMASQNESVSCCSCGVQPTEGSSRMNDSTSTRALLIGDNIAEAVSRSNPIKQGDEVPPPPGFGFNRSSQMNIDMALISEDIDISHFSPINSTASIIVRSNSVPLEALTCGSEDNCSIENSYVSNLSRKSDLCLSVNPLKPEYGQRESAEMSAALCSLYGASLGGNTAHDEKSPKSPPGRSPPTRCRDEGGNRQPPRGGGAAGAAAGAGAGVSLLRIGRSDAQCMWRHQPAAAAAAPSPRRLLQWHEMNKRRDILHHPAVASSPRAVFVADDDTSPEEPAVLITSLSFAAQKPMTNILCDKSTSKRCWRRNKDEHAPLWKPRHAISTKKKKFSTIRTVKM